MLSSNQLTVFILSPQPDVVIILLDDNIAPVIWNYLDGNIWHWNFAG
jgi:hypothetical protein